MKTLQLFIALFCVAVTSDTFAGKTIRNSSYQPKAKEQYLKNREQERTFAPVTASSVVATRSTAMTSSPYKVALLSNTNLAAK